MKFSANFLRGPQNVSLDLMRVIGAFVAFVAYPGPYLWNVVEHGIVPDPMAYGSAWAVVIGAIAAAIFAKDIGVAKANAISTQQGVNQ